MKAIIWAAVSSRSQVKAGRSWENVGEGDEALDSIERQIEDGRKACEAFDWEVTQTLVVPGHTRNYVFYQDAREEIAAYGDLADLCERNQALQAEGKPKLADVLVCRARDRLGRTDALIAQVEEMARRAGIQVFSLSMPSAIMEPGAGHDVGALYVAAIERARAQDQVMTLRHYYDKGMRSRIKRGLPASNVPYGYLRTDKDRPPVQVPQEVTAVRLMGELYLRGWGTGRIAGHLNEVCPEHRPRRASAWRSCTIYKILANPFYAGLVQFRGTVAVGGHEPVWAPAEWAKLQTEHSRRTRTRGKATLPYSGIVRCLMCGGVMSINVNRKVRSWGEYTLTYYRCNSGWQSGTERRDNPHKTSVRAERIRAAVMEAVADVPLVEDVMDARRAELEQARGQWQAALEESEEEVRKLLEAYGRWGNVSADAFDEAMADVTKRQEAIQSHLAEATLLLDGIPTDEERRGLLADLAANIGTVLDMADVAEANAWLAKRVRAIWCEGRRVVRVELV